MAVAENQIKEFSPNMEEMDFVKLSIAILLFLYICEKPGELAKFKTLLNLIPNKNTQGQRHSLEEFAKCWMAMDSETFVAKAILNVTKAIMSENTEQIFK